MKCYSQRDSPPGEDYRTAVLGWTQDNKADIAATFLVPNRMVAKIDHISLSDELTHCFNRLDRLVYKSAHRVHGVRVSRFVALERTDSVGWHAHALFTTPNHMTSSELILQLQYLWPHQLRKFISHNLEQDLFWADPITGNYFDYATKNIGHGAQADWLNTVFTTPRGTAA